MVHVDRHIGFYMGENMNAPDFSLDVLTGSVVPRKLHSKFRFSGRYNANDYVIQVSVLPRGLHPLPRPLDQSPVLLMPRDIGVDSRCGRRCMCRTSRRWRMAACRV